MILQDHEREDNGKARLFRIAGHCVLWIYLCSTRKCIVAGFEVSQRWFWDVPSSQLTFHWLVTPFLPTTGSLGCAWAHTGTASQTSLLSFISIIAYNLPRAGSCHIFLTTKASFSCTIQFSFLAMSGTGCRSPRMCSCWSTISWRQVHLVASWSFEAATQNLFFTQNQVKCFDSTKETYTQYLMVFYICHKFLQVQSLWHWNITAR